MIEKVARAMYSNYDWGCDHGMKDIMYNCAKLAIEAMREPTKEMMIATNHSSSIREAWSDAIDAALKEE